MNPSVIGWFREHNFTFLPRECFEKIIFEGCIPGSFNEKGEQVGRNGLILIKDIFLFIKRRRSYFHRHERSSWACTEMFYQKK